VRSDRLRPYHRYYKLFDSVGTCQGVYLRYLLFRGYAGMGEVTCPPMLNDFLSGLIK